MKTLKSSLSTSIIIPRCDADLPATVLESKYLKDARDSLVADIETGFTLETDREWTRDGNLKVTLRANLLPSSTADDDMRDRNLGSTSR